MTAIEKDTDLLQKTDAQVSNEDAQNYCITFEDIVEVIKAAYDANRVDGKRFEYSVEYYENAFHHLGTTVRVATHVNRFVKGYKTTDKYGVKEVKYGYIGSYGCHTRRDIEKVIGRIKADRYVTDAVDFYKDNGDWFDYGVEDDED